MKTLKGLIDYVKSNANGKRDAEELKEISDGRKRSALQFFKRRSVSEMIREDRRFLK